MPAAALEASAPGMLFSRTVTAAPRRARARAQEVPMMPPPTTRTWGFAVERRALERPGEADRRERAGMSRGLIADTLTDGSVGDQCNQRDHRRGDQRSGSRTGRVSRTSP